MPEEGKNGQGLPFTNQSVGAEGVNTLSSKLVLTLLPSDAPFFRLEPSYSLDDGEDIDEAVKRDLDKGLSKVERTIHRSIAATKDRVALEEALKHVVISGNVLLHINSDDNAMRCFHLDRYVIERDGSGNVLEIITHEKIAFAILPQEIKDAVLSSKEFINSDKKPDKDVDIYTHVRREKDIWHVHQETCGIEIDDTRGTYPLDACPWIPIAFNRISGEDYGRGHVEEYYGDLYTYDALSEAIAQGSAACAKVLFLVAPNGTTRAEDLAKADNLDFVAGTRKDVETLQVEKHADLRVAKEYLMEIEKRLSRAFILHSAIQRNGERVTAEEIRVLTRDLDAALGGKYSLLAAEFQLPYLNCKIRQLEQQRKIPYLDRDLVSPLIITGIEAIGRGNDRDKLLELVQGLRNGLGEKGLERLNVGEFTKRYCAALGIDSDGLIITDDEMTQAQEEQQTQHNIDTLGAPAMNNIGKLMQSGQIAPEAIGQILGD